MNIGEKISLYKERLKFRNFQEFGKAAGVNGSWLLELSKKDKVSFIDANNLKQLCKYLHISTDQLLKDDEELSSKSFDIENIDDTDISVKIKEIIELLDKDDVKIDGQLFNNQAKEVGKESLQVVKQLIKQYL